MYKKKKGKRKNTWKNSCRSSKSNVITRYKILIVNDIEFMTFPRVVLGITWRVNEEYPFCRSFFFFSFFLFFFFFSIKRTIVEQAFVFPISSPLLFLSRATTRTRSSLWLRYNTVFWDDTAFDLWTEARRISLFLIAARSRFAES